MKFLQSPNSPAAISALAILSLWAVFPFAVQANPSGEIVINGSFKIENLGDTMKIIQQSQKGIIHWDDFSIKSGEITQFIQPNSSSAVLNRVTGSARSDIMGQLLANGNVWLINPNGILVGPGARIDVGGLILSTLDIADDDFLRGGDLKFGGASNAAITNYGTIQAAQGGVFVIAQKIENHGLIGALDGRVVLAADNEVLLQQGSDGNIFLSGEVGKGHILNNGEVVAADVSMLARNNNVFAMAVQNNGIARAQKVDTSGGRVRLVAQGGAGVDQAGTVNADGVTGGRIEVSSEGAVQVNGRTTARGTNGWRGDQHRIPHVQVRQDWLWLGNRCLHGDRRRRKGRHQGFRCSPQRWNHFRHQCSGHRGHRPDDWRGHRNWRSRGNQRIRGDIGRRGQGRRVPVFGR